MRSSGPRQGRVARDPAYSGLPGWVLVPAAAGAAFVVVPLLALGLRVDWSRFGELLGSPSSLAALTLSISLGALLNATWLLTGLVRKGGYSPQPGWGKAIAQIVLATAVLGAGLWGVQQYIDWGSLHAAWRIAYLLGTMAAVGAAYFAMLALLGFPVRQMMRR